MKNKRSKKKFKFLHAFYFVLNLKMEALECLN